MFLEIHTDRRRKNAYFYGLFRETFRENGQVRHRTRGRVTGLRHEQLLTLRDFIRRGCPGPGEASCEVSDSREWGAGLPAGRQVTPCWRWPGPWDCPSCSTLDGNRGCVMRWP